MRHKKFKPKKENKKYNIQVWKIVYSLLMDIDHSDIEDWCDWYICCINGVRGTCYYERKGVTIPAWSVERDRKDEGYLTYYIAHELSHIFAYRRHNEKNHGMKFMREFKKICPKEYQHYELEYKPLNAKKAGIKEKEN